MKHVPLATLAGYGASRLHRAALKVTHVGEQTEPVPSLVVASYFHLPSLDAFRSLRYPSLSYANDELPDVWCFCVSPQEFARMLSALNRLCASALAPGAAAIAASVLIDLPGGAEGAESLLPEDRVADLYRELEAALASDNGTGRAVLGMR
jgi:hypothetical protein